MKRSLPTLLLAAALVALGLPAWGGEPRGPRVVVSIKPIHSLVAGVMAGVGEPALLVSGSGSPHGYTLRPSEARLLSEAQLIVWVGPRLEGFMEKPLATLGTGARQLELTRALASRLLPVREGGGWDDHPHEGGAGVPSHEHQGSEEANPHLWLDPLLAREIVTRVAAELSALDPVHTRRYQDNAAQLRERLEALNARLQEKLAPVRDVPYVVFHDAYPYFERAYHLNAVGSVTLSAERKPGARRIVEIRDKIRRLKARCVFSEPQFEPRLVATIIEGTGARTGTLDPLGAELPSGPDCYFLLMNALADHFLRGLQ